MLICGMGSSFYANTLDTNVQICKKTVFKIVNSKLVCQIFTTIRTLDENRNVIDERTVKTEGSGLSCIGADSDGIVRNVRTVRVEGIHP